MGESELLGKTGTGAVLVGRGGGEDGRPSAGGESTLHCVGLQADSAGNERVYEASILQGR